MQFRCPLLIPLVLLAALPFLEAAEKPSFSATHSKMVETDWLLEYAQFPSSKRPFVDYAKVCSDRAFLLADDLTKSGLDTAAQRRRLQGAMEKIAALGNDTPLETAKAAYLALRWEIRALVFANPKLDFEELLFYSRRNGKCFPDVSSISMVWAGSPGGDLSVLKIDRSGGPAQVRTLLNGRLPAGHVHGIDLHWDGKRLLFGYVQNDQDYSKSKCRPGHDAWLKSGPGCIYEINIDGTGLRQITKSERFHDVAPTYLPDGGVAFMSDRSLSGVQCNQPEHDELFANLYACKADGSDLFRLVNNANGDYNPHTLDDGRVGFMRWEYNERMFVHSLWAVRPDGRYAEPIFAQHLGPGSVQKMIVDARNIPGSDRLVATASGHYNFERGVIVTIDPKCGINNFKQGMRTVPEGLPVWEGLSAPTRSKIGFYTTPWALSEKYVVCGYEYCTDQSDPVGFGLYLVDSFGNRELLLRNPQCASIQPIPLRARPAPKLIPRGDSTEAEATCLLADVTDGTEFLRPGDAKYLRIIENLVWPYTVEDGEMRYRVEDAHCENYTAKRIIGDVPIAADGSAHFIVPVDKPIYFEILDANHQEIRRMRSWISFQPGEKRGCIGCHETRTTAPRATSAVPTAFRQAPARPKAVVSWGDKPVNFLRDIQPIFDKNCVSCHAGIKAAGACDLSGGLTRKYNIAYETLFGYQGFRPSAALAKVSTSVNVVFPLLAAPHRLNYDYPTPPRNFGSSQALLLKVLENETHRSQVKLSPQDRIDLSAWIDLNAPYHDRSFSKRRNPSVVPAMTPDITAIFKQRCVSCHAEKDLARPDWINIATPERSRFLTAPLAKTAGGDERCGKAVFANTDDPEYVKLLTWTRTQAILTWTKPRRDVMGLIEAGRMPAWVTETTKKP